MHDPDILLVKALANELSADEQQAWRELLDTSEEYRQKYRLSRKIRQTTRASFAPPQASAPPRRSLLFSRVAALLLVTAIVSVWVGVQHVNSLLDGEQRKLAQVVDAKERELQKLREQQQMTEKQLEELQNANRELQRQVEKLQGPMTNGVLYIKAKLGNKNYVEALILELRVGGTIDLPWQADLKNGQKVQLHATGEFISKDSLRLRGKLERYRGKEIQEQREVDFTLQSRGEELRAYLAGEIEVSFRFEVSE